MKVLGYCLLAAGVIYLIIAFNMDVTVRTPTQYVPYVGSIGGQEVANLDLMERRQNHLIVACLVTLIGALLAIFGKDEEPATSKTRVANGTAGILDAGKFEGERDLSADRYRLWLAEKYEIQRNPLFERFVLGDQTFETLDAALLHAHAEEVRLADEARQAEEEREERLREEAEERAWRIEQEEAEWQERKPKLIAVTIIAFGGLIAFVWSQTESPEERAARLAAEEAEQAQLVASVEEAIGISLPADATRVRIENDADATIACDAMESVGTEYSFESRTSLAEMKEQFTEVYGPEDEQGSYSISIADGVWSSDDRRVSLLNLIEFDFSVCVEMIDG